MPEPPIAAPAAIVGALGGSEATTKSPSVKRIISMLRNVSTPSIVAPPPFRGSETVTVPFALSVTV